MKWIALVKNPNNIPAVPCVHPNPNKGKKEPLSKSLEGCSFFHRISQRAAGFIMVPWSCRMCLARQKFPFFPPPWVKSCEKCKSLGLFWKGREEDEVDSTGWDWAWPWLSLLCVVSWSCTVVKPLEGSVMEMAKPRVIQLLEEADVLCCFFLGKKI